MIHSSTEKTGVAESRDSANAGTGSGMYQPDNRTESVAQRKLKQLVSESGPGIQLRSYQSVADTYTTQLRTRPNRTGLPDTLKSGVEALSGYAMDDVKVHYNSSQPKQLQAHAFARGTNIHVAQGQEKHLPHEAWHVVQQKQGRVKPTVQMKNKVAINDDAGLEKEADVMGAKAAGFNPANDVTALMSFDRARELDGAAIQLFVIQLFRRTRDAAVNLLQDPARAEQLTPVPAHTRISIIRADDAGVYGPAEGPTKKVYIEITTGPQTGIKGWVQQQDLDAADQPARAQVTIEKATELFNELKGAKFTDSTGREANIPFSYPIDGCYARAHRMMELLAQKGYSAEKSFAVARSDKKLRVPSPKAGDVPRGTPPVVEWGYHVAPVITIEGGAKYVIDPSMFTLPVPLRDWVGGMGSIADFRERRVADLEAEYANKRDEDHYYLAPAAHYFPVRHGGHLPENAADTRYNEVGIGAGVLGKDRMMDYAVNHEPAHILVSKYREKIAAALSIQEKYTQLLAISDATDEAVKARAKVLFPQLYKELEIISHAYKYNNTLIAAVALSEKYRRITEQDANGLVGDIPARLNAAYPEIFRELQVTRLAGSYNQVVSSGATIREKNTRLAAIAATYSMDQKNLCRITFPDLYKLLDATTLAGRYETIASSALGTKEKYEQLVEIAKTEEGAKKALCRATFPDLYRQLDAIMLAAKVLGLIK